MAITRFPALSSTFELFDWDDHPDSEDALYSGGLTAEFDNETWNAIVSLLADALDGSGIGWDNTYTTASEAKLDPYENLSAKIFNSVRYNINRVVPIHFDWATDPNFRGYVGREDFRGYSTHGESSDDVYPEYIYELVFRLNQMIEVLKGDKADIIDLDEELILSSHEAYLVQKLPLPFGALEYSESIDDVRVRRGLAKRFGHKYIVDSSYDFTIYGRRVGLLRPKNNIAYSRSKTILRSGKLKRVAMYKWLSESITNANIIPIRKSWVIPEGLLLSSSSKSVITKGLSSNIPLVKTRVFSLSKSGIVKIPALVTSGKGLSRSFDECFAEYIYGKPIGITDEMIFSQFREEVRVGKAGQLGKKELSYSNYENTLRGKTALQTGSKLISKSEFQNGISTKKIALVDADDISRTNSNSELIGGTAGHVRSGSHTKTSNKLTLTEGASGPIYIRAHTNTDHKATADKIAVARISEKHNSKSMCAMRLGTAWYPPVWTDKGLYIRQTYDKPMFAKGLIDVAAKAESKTITNGDIVIGWMMPVQTDKGLYIRQINGELEVM